MSRTKTEKDNAIKKMKLPNQLIPIKNADKEFHEHWYEGRSPLNIPAPWRACLIGSPGVGKSTTVKNILLRAKPPFEQLFIIHCDPDNTNEYSDVGGIFLKEFPPTESWDSTTKKLVIIDDIDIKSLSKEQMASISRLYGYASTHKNICVALCQQDAFQIPAIVRRCSRLFILWRPRDLDSLGTVARKSGMKSKDMLSIFDQLMPEYRDSLWLDLTIGSPYPLRKSGFEMISKTSECEDTRKLAETLDTFEVK